jgi:hypothetical protein
LETLHLLRIEERPRGQILSRGGERWRAGNDQLIKGTRKSIVAGKQSAHRS